MNEAHAEDTVNHQAGKGSFTKLSTFMDVKSKQTWKIVLGFVYEGRLNVY